MKIDVTLELSNGKKIELTEAEVLELRSRLNAIYGWPASYYVPQPTYQPVVPNTAPYVVKC